MFFKRKLFSVTCNIPDERPDLNFAHRTSSRSDIIMFTGQHHSTDQQHLPFSYLEHLSPLQINYL